MVTHKGLITIHRRAQLYSSSPLKMGPLLLSNLGTFYVQNLRQPIEFAIRDFSPMVRDKWGIGQSLKLIQGGD